MQKRNSTNMKPLECFLHQPFPFSLVQCSWIVSMMWCVVTDVCRRLLIFLQSCVHVRLEREVEFCSNTLSLYLSAHVDPLHTLTNVNLLSVCISMFILPLHSGSSVSSRILIGFIDLFPSRGRRFILS